MHLQGLNSVCGYDEIAQLRCAGPELLGVVSRNRIQVELAEQLARTPSGLRRFKASTEAVQAIDQNCLLRGEQHRYTVLLAQSSKMGIVIAARLIVQLD
ncbi:hypothetical protein DIR46_00575 [Massilia oculi]|uniref:Uncharacterized protein n=1 Tax=Massilia oculi TaxID=945844 RepID=A0A2S2DCM9_9BURK|nr:hypothetical protein DIR46_00575 [Massilia oculi]